MRNGIVAGIVKHHLVGGGAYHTGCRTRTKRPPRQTLLARERRRNKPAISAVGECCRLAGGINCVEAATSTIPVAGIADVGVDVLIAVGGRANAALTNALHR